MEEIELTNPLTDQEKLQARRLISHNFMNKLAAIRISNRNSIGPLLWHLEYITLAIDYLQRGSFHLAGNFPKEAFRNKPAVKSLDTFIEEIKGLYLYSNEIRTHVESHTEFLACKPLLHAALVNLINNSFTAQSGKKYTLLRTEYREGFPEKALFIPEGARNYKDFMAFHVIDEGPGFPTDVPLIQRLTTRPEEGKHRFGLYFTGLAARVMRAPVNIKSKPGETIVSVYYPIYETSG